MEKTLEKFVALAKSRGFVYPGSEIYGGLANTWDYGNLGVELKNNVKKAWWKKFIQESPYNVGVDCAILMNPQTWVASGHLGGFSDPLMDCKECHERFRADKIIEDYAEEHGYTIVREIGGHGIGLEFHEEPWVSYVSKRGTEMMMVPGLVFTIEPMVNMGKADIYEDDENGWTIYTEDGKPAAQWEIQVLVTEDGYEILSY